MTWQTNVSPEFMFHKVKWFYYNLLLTFANCDISYYGRGIFCALLSTRSTLSKGNTKLWVLKREEGREDAEDIYHFPLECN